MTKVLLKNGEVVEQYFKWCVIDMNYPFKIYFESYFIEDCYEFIENHKDSEDFDFEILFDRCDILNFVDFDAMSLGTWYERINMMKVGVFYDEFLQCQD